MARGTWGGAGDPNVFRVIIRFLLGSQHCQTGFHLRDVAINDNTEQEVADEVRAQLWGPFRNMLYDSDTLEDVEAQILGQDTGAVAAGAAQAGTIAFNADQMLPSFVSCNIVLKSEIRKRYGQGRMFVPMRKESQISGDNVSAEGLVFVNDLITAMTDHFTGDPVTHDLLLVNAHGILPARPPVGSSPGRPEIPASWYDVVSVRANSIATSLRSRKVGVGS